MRRFWAIGLGTLMIASSGWSRTAPPETVVAVDAVARLVETLVAETSSLGERERRLSEREGGVVRASITLRRLTVDLLRRGSELGDLGAIAQMTGLRLASARQDVDAALDPLAEGTASVAWSAAAERLRAFNDADAAPPAPADVAGGAALDEYLSRRLRPLAELVAELQDRALASHWPAANRLAPAVDPSSPSAPDPWPGLQTAAGDERLDEPLRAVLADLLAARPTLASAPHAPPAIDDVARSAAGLGELLAGDLRGPALRLAREQTELAARLPARLAEAGFETDGDLAIQSRITGDVALLQEIQSWITGLRAIHAPSANGFATHARRWAETLGVPRKRPEALDTLAEMRRQYDTFIALPFEERLRTSSPEAAALTGGQQVALARIVAQTHRRWVQAWGRGDFDPASHVVMQALSDLLHVMEESAASMRAIGRDPLQRWAGVELPTTTLVGVRNELYGRTKLAAAAAIAEDGNALQRHVEALQDLEPIIRLAGRVDASIGPELRALPGGALGALAKSMTGPDEDAWWGGHRAALARLSLEVWALDEARRAGDETAILRQRAAVRFGVLELLDDGPGVD